MQKLTNTKWAAAASIRTGRSYAYIKYINIYSIYVCADIGVVALSVRFLLSHFFLRFVSRGLRRRLSSGEIYFRHSFFLFIFFLRGVAT